MAAVSARPGTMPHSRLACRPPGPRATPRARRAPPTVEKEVAQLDAAQRQLQLQVERLLDAYQRGAMSVQELQARRERLDAAMDAARIRREDLAGQQMGSRRIRRIADDLPAIAAARRRRPD